MQLINLTPHTINEVTTGVQIAPSGRVARVKATTEKTGEFAGFPIFESVWGEVEGLPEPQPDTMYIVSALALNAAPTRKDILAPGNLVRNEQGQPIGCVGFRRN